MTPLDRLKALAEPSRRTSIVYHTPKASEENVLGVEIQSVRSIAAELCGTPEAQEFLRELPHTYYEEYLLHAFLIDKCEDFDTVIREVELLLPHLDSWALIDLLSPRIFLEAKDRLLPFIDKWMASDKPLVIGYGVLMLMRHYLDDDSKAEYVERVEGVGENDLYAGMMISWYMATSIAKQYFVTVNYPEDKKLISWARKAAITRALDIRRISKEKKGSS